MFQTALLHARSGAASVPDTRASHACHIERSRAPARQAAACTRRFDATRIACPSWLPGRRSCVPVLSAIRASRLPPPKRFGLKAAASAYHKELSELLGEELADEAQVLLGSIDVAVSGITYDSRQVKPGSLFVCVEGFAVDGHQYIKSAVEAGAAAVLVTKAVDKEAELAEAWTAAQQCGATVVRIDDTRNAMADIAARFYGYPASGMRAVGITGTNGKTTTSYLVRSILRAHGERVGLVGTIAYMVEEETFPAPFTTPEAIDLQALIASMARTGPYAEEAGPDPCDALVMEVSSHALELGRVRGIEYDTAVFTNLTRDHLDFHKTFDAYRDAKAKLFLQLRLAAAKAATRPKAAVLNGDDPEAAFFAAVARGEQGAAIMPPAWNAGLGDFMCTSDAGCEIDWDSPEPAPVVPTLVPHVLTYGLEATNDVHPVATKLTLFESEIRIRTPRAAGKAEEFGGEGPREEITVRTKLRGAVNVYNVLAAVAVAVANRIPGETIVRGLEAVESVSGRFESVSVGPQQNFGVIVDYAHTPDALERLLKGVREIMDPKARLIAVFGCGGDRDAGKRPIMGRLGAELADYTIVTSDNPRTEDPEKIVAQVAEGAVQGGGRYEVVVDRRAAIERAVALAGAGDALVIAGKGHEDYQILGKTKIHFDDREEAAAFLARRFP
eukprot:tig00001376_g8533.t1